MRLEHNVLNSKRNVNTNINFISTSGIGVYCILYMYSNAGRSEYWCESSQERKNERTQERKNARTKKRENKEAGTDVKTPESPVEAESRWTPTVTRSCYSRRIRNGAQLVASSEERKKERNLFFLSYSFLQLSKLATPRITGLLLLSVASDGPRVSNSFGINSWTKETKKYIKIYIYYCQLPFLRLEINVC